jgi:hypothetical protein
MMAPHTALTMRASVAARPTATTTTKTTGAKRGALQVVGAASKAKKNRDLDRLRDLANAEETLLVAGFNYQGLTVRFVTRANARARATGGGGGGDGAGARSVGVEVCAIRERARGAKRRRRRMETRANGGKYFPRSHASMSARSHSRARGRGDHDANAVGWLS